MTQDSKQIVGGIAAVMIAELLGAFLFGVVVVVLVRLNVIGMEILRWFE